MTQHTIQMYAGPFKTADDHPYWASLFTAGTRADRPRRAKRMANITESHLLGIYGYMRTGSKSLLLLALLAEAKHQ